MANLNRGGEIYKSFVYLIYPYLYKTSISFLMIVKYKEKDKMKKEMESVKKIVKCVY